MLGLPPQTPLPDSEQLASAELLHTCAHPRNLAFEMPGNRNGASDRGGRAAPHYGWKGEECPERLRQLQAVDEQLSNDTLADGMDCFKNKKPELAERAFGKVLSTECGAADLRLRRCRRALRNRKLLLMGRASSLTMGETDK